MRLADLEAVPAEIWKKLQAANGAWRIPVLASVASGMGADARTVVLRQTDANARQIVFFTDRRSRKFAQLEVNPHVCLLVFDETLRWQVRLYGEAASIGDAARLDNWWAGLADFQRANYAADVLASDMLHEKGRENFAAFVVTIERMHCLWLHDQGNEAAEFEWQGTRWHGRPARP